MALYKLPASKNAAPSSRYEIAPRVGVGVGTNSGWTVPLSIPHIRYKPAMINPAHSSKRAGLELAPGLWKRVFRGRTRMVDASVVRGCCQRHACLGWLGRSGWFHAFLIFTDRHHLFGIAHGDLIVFEVSDQRLGDGQGFSATP